MDLDRKRSLTDPAAAARCIVTLVRLHVTHASLLSTCWRLSDPSPEVTYGYTASTRAWKHPHFDLPRDVCVVPVWDRGSRLSGTHKHLGR